MKTKEDIIFEQVGLEGTLKHVGCYDAVLKAMDDFAEQERSKNCTIHGVIKRFIRGEIKIKIDDPTKKHIMRYIFNECGFEIKENHYTYEKGRFFWVEEGRFDSGLKHVHNSMDLLLRNRDKHTINLSDLNVL